MFSMQQKRDISEKVQAILRETNHPELPEGEITFALYVNGAESWSWADIQNNKAVPNPGIDPWNEQQATDPLGPTKSELLEACKAMLHAVETYGHFDKTDRLARAVIAKAEGNPSP